MQISEKNGIVPPQAKRALLVGSGENFVPRIPLCGKYIVNNKELASPIVSCLSNHQGH